MQKSIANGCVHVPSKLFRAGLLHIKIHSKNIDNIKQVYTTWFWFIYINIYIYCFNRRAPFVAHIFFWHVEMFFHRPHSIVFNIRTHQHQVCKSMKRWKLLKAKIGFRSVCLHVCFLFSLVEPSQDKYCL